MDYIATQKFLRMSPKKVRLVADLARKMSPVDAIERLPFSGKRAAKPLAKVIMTAIANAKKQGANEADLVIKEIQIGEGPRLKRFRAGARGRAKPYARRMSHIRVVLATVKNEAKKAGSKNEKATEVKGEAKGKTNADKSLKIERKKPARKGIRSVLTRKGGKAQGKSAKPAKKSA